MSAEIKIDMILCGLIGCCLIFRWHKLYSWWRDAIAIILILVGVLGVLCQLLVT